MASPKTMRPRRTSKEVAIGLLAIGSSGPWEIGIDQTISGRERWFAQIEGPSVSLYFEIPAPRIVDEAISFLSNPERSARRSGSNGKKNGTLTLGNDPKMPVSLMRDDEFSDRYFLVFESSAGTVVRLTVAGEDRTHLVDALRQAKEDMEELSST
jgi:hypothetical protein